MIAALSSTSTPTARPTIHSTTRPSADEVFKKLDSGGKGYLTQDDLVKISAKGADAADTAKAAEAFKRMDSDGDGKVTQSEFKQAAPPEGQAPASAGSAKAPPAGGAKGAAPAGGGAASGGSASTSASTSSEDIDPADANEDGKVSQQEQLAYDTQQQAKAANKPGGQAGEAIKAYEAVQNTEA